MAVMNAMVGGVNNKLKQMPNSSPSQIKKVPPIIVTKRRRESKRLHLKQKRRVGNTGNSLKTVIHRTVEFTTNPIDYGNPKEKLLFMTALGLLPRPTALTEPHVKLERLFDSTSPKIITNSSRNHHQNNAVVTPTPTTTTTNTPSLPQTTTICRKSDRLHKNEIPRLTTTQHAVKETYQHESRKNNNNTPILYTDSDIEDLELLICPLDIPEFMVEFYGNINTKSGNSTSNTISNDTNVKHNINKRNNYNTYNSRRQIRNHKNRNHNNNNTSNKLQLKRNRKNINNNNNINRNRSITQSYSIPFIDLTDDSFDDDDYIPLSYVI